MPGDPLTSTEGLALGDVLLVSKKLIDKRTGEPFWWKTFRCVVDPPSGMWVTLLILKMNPDLDKDRRLEAITLTPETVFVKLEPHEWPQGVLATRTKLIAQGIIDLVGGSATDFQF